MRKRVMRVSLIMLVVISLTTYTGVALARNINVEINNTDVPHQIDSEELAEVHELFIIINDLMMAVEMRNRLINGDTNTIEFSDGSEIVITIPPNVITELDKKIADLKDLIVTRTEEKASKWKR